MKPFQHVGLYFFLVAMSTVGMAQTPPASPTATAPAKSESKTPAPKKEVITSTKPVDADGQKQIKEFISNRAAIILNSDPKRARQATSDVLGVVRQSGATPIFLRACLDTLKPFVANVMATNNSFRIINMLEIIRYTNTPEAVDILIEQVTPSIQKNVVIRIAAGRLLPSCIPSANMNAPQLDRAARNIRTAADEETNWIVNVHEMQSLAAMITFAQDSKLMPQIELSREEFLKVLTGISNKTLNPSSEGADQVFALQRGLIMLRDILLKTPKDQILNITSQIRPITQKVKQLAASGVISDASLKQSESGSLKVAATIDTLIGDKATATPAKSPI
ncbi:MAG: hypothetical protein EXS12_05035 [Phycisphaerales bacterium]|nr:hypothetical protein [Phycisphaerales bacterium]